MTSPLAHSGHWYHTVLYVAPVILIALGLWWSRAGRDERARQRRATSDRRRRSGPSDPVLPGGRT